jgi:hypothetical protein
MSGVRAAAENCDCDCDCDSDSDSDSDSDIKVFCLVFSEKKSLPHVGKV